MSSLFKSGFVNMTNGNTTPFVIDANTRIIGGAPKESEKSENSENSDESAENQSPDGADDFSGGVRTAENQLILDDAMEKAKDIRDDARDKANKLIEEAWQEAESIKENAYKEGYENGLEDGNMEAMKRADVYLANLNDEQEKIKADMLAKNEAYLDDAEKKLVNLTCELIKKISGIIVDDYKPAMLNMINNALYDVESTTKYTIKVCEESYAYVADNSERIVGAANPNITIDVFADAKLEKGQCIIETDNGIIDLSMDIQIQNLITAFKLLS
ncbi:MAG: hypothetical protein IJT72_03495 [Lachnospiraceae bacterium]|nr:hypothetical protein [Lachnospiraceae bacterium]